MKKFVVFTILFLQVSMSYSATDTTKIGIFINNIYDLNIRDKSYDISMWLWMNYKNDDLSFKNSIELRNSKLTEFSLYGSEKKGSYNWEYMKLHAKIIKNWDIRDFPFDKQVLRIDFEDSQNDTSEIIYIADVDNSKIDESLKIDDWEITDFYVISKSRTYKTTYGDPTLTGESVYTGMRASITLKREKTWSTFFSILTGCFIAFLISIIIFFIPATQGGSRIGLVVGGLFTGIGNKYFVSSSLNSTYNTLIDNIQNITLIWILLIVIFAIFSINYAENALKKGIEYSIKYDIAGFIIITFSYVSILAYLVFKAM